MVSVKLSSRRSVRNVSTQDIYQYAGVLRIFGIDLMYVETFRTERLYARIWGLTRPRIGTYIGIWFDCVKKSK
jgi:hypothetical protein